MEKQPKSLKYKVIIGYILLFIIAVISVWFIYTEILKVALRNPNSSEDNKKIIQISNTIANLYASEAIGRTSILTGSTKDYDKYNQLIDSISHDIDIIKTDIEIDQISKFDSIQLLLQRKKNSITEIVNYRRKYNQSNTFGNAIDRIYNVKDSIISKVEPIRSQKQYQWRDFVNAALTPMQMDSLSKLPVSNDSLALAFDKIIKDLLIKENRLKHELYTREQKLLDENRIISDQLRFILSSVEKEILQKSYIKIQESEAAVTETIKTMAWIGALALLVLIFFAWIIIRDITTNQNYRKRLELLNTENEDLLRSKTMLLATVTHDMQTPLGSIIGFSDLLKNTNITPRQNQYLENIKSSSDYILKLVNDLVDFSKLEKDRITIENISFNVKDLIENTCKTLQPNASNKNIALNWTIQENLNNNFVSDPYRIRQILTNLISNSIKFTQEGSVTLTAKIVNNFIQIVITDTGIGIAKEKQEDIFKEFTQAHAGIEKKFGGTGLGLTISKRLLELLGGEILLESVEGKGSVFTLTLPCIQSQTPIYTPKYIENQYDFLKDKRILIVDDDKIQLSLMQEIFSNYSVKVISVIDSSTVINTLENNDFDLVLTDIQMPILDGFELIKLIRNSENPKITHIPVIALSGKRDINDITFINNGFTAHHTKPLQLEQLLLLIQNIFEGTDNTIIEEKESSPTYIGNKLYSLTGLNQFTNNNQESLNIILETFITSAIENCEELRKAANENNNQKLAELAHKMIPMLKQIEVYSIVKLLEPLEERNFSMNPLKIKEHIVHICKKINDLITALKKEII